MTSIRVQDKYNSKKEWEVIKLSGGYYLKQYIGGRQFGRGARVRKWFLENIFDAKIEYKNGKLELKETK